MKKYIFYGMMRSGNHAILFWLLHNLGKIKPLHNGVMYSNEEETCFYYNDISNTYHRIWKHIFSKINQPNTTHLFISVEDVYFVDNKKFLVDDLSKYRKVFIIRDFLNMHASRKKGVIHRPIKDIRIEIALWKKMCETGKSSIIINYNKWLSSKNYRYEISKLLEIPNINDNMFYIPNIGRGSSFTGLKKRDEDYNHYLERYKMITISPNDREIILNDEELIRLNKDLFDMDLIKCLNNL